VTLDTEDVQIAQKNECNSTEHKSKQQSTDSDIQLVLERTTQATMRVRRLWSFTWEDNRVNGMEDRLLMFGYLLQQ
jgi:hypothetical protein